MDSDMEASSIDSMDRLSETWCSSAIQLFEPASRGSSIMLRETNITESDEKQGTEDGETLIPPLKLDDVKSWIWLQQAIHPELDYDLSFKKWFSWKLNPRGISIRKWLKEMKQKRKEDERLRKAKVYAAISVAGVAAVLAALAADNNTIANQPKSLKQAAVASAAALVAAQCAHAAEAAGAKHNQLAAAIDAAMATTDASNIITLTATASTSLKGVAALRGRPAHRERIKGSTPPIMNDELNYDYGRCRALLAKGDNLLVGTPDGKCRLRSVSITLNIDGKVILKIKKFNFLIVFSSAKESIVYALYTKPFKEPMKKDVASYSMHMDTSKGRIELNINDYMKYRKWTTTINHMLTVSATLSK